MRSGSPRVPDREAGGQGHRPVEKYGENWADFEIADYILNRKGLELEVTKLWDDSTQKSLSQYILHLLYFPLFAKSS